MTLYQQAMDTPTQGPLTREVFDVVVIGAGVVGCAIARRFALEGAHVAVVEKASDILDGASKANSAILHTGFDAAPDSVELACIRDGYREYSEIHAELSLPLEKTGAHMVAWSEDEVEKLESILQQAHQNGITTTKLIGARELAGTEPELAKKALAALHVEGESIIDPWSAPHAYLRQSICNGGKVFRSCKVTAGVFEADKWQLQTSRGTLDTRYVINCAGLYGDRLDQALCGEAGFRITPRKGQFVVFDKAASRLVNSIILPVPCAKTKGIVICRTIFGNLLVGPTAEDQDSRSDSSTDRAAIEALIATGVDKVPALKSMPVTAVYAGLRPATEHKEYQIKARPQRNWITVGGIRSTGLSSALGIARYVYKIYSGLGPKHSRPQNPGQPQGPYVLAENGLRDWRRDEHGEIVCHCELVSEREIRAALSGPLAARSLSGLKRQTRAMMGRCQGFYCSARLAEITEGHFKTPLGVKAEDEQ